MSRTRIAVVSLFIALCLPFSASAASIAELQAQLTTLMAQITALQERAGTGTIIL